MHQSFKEYLIAPPFYDIKRKRYDFQTLLQENFKVRADIFYTDKNNQTRNKVLTSNKISPVTGAYWFMDLGGLLSYNKERRRSDLVFNTQPFSFQEVEKISQNLLHSYNLNTSVKENNKKPRRAVSGKSYITIRNRMYPHIVECMRSLIAGKILIPQLVEELKT